MAQKRKMTSKRRIGKGSRKRVFVKSRKKLKLKTRRGAHKRFEMTASGKIKRKRANLRHILTSKTTKQKRRLRSKGFVSHSDQGKVEKLLPYG